MENNAPLISVTMITYNHEKYISEAIESVLNQTFTDFELIIVNDGSTDKTEEIIKNCQDNRIVYIYQENQGPSTAINNAILGAKGKYVAIMSGDDVSHLHKLERQYEYISQSKYKVIFSWVDFIDDDSKFMKGENLWVQKHYNCDNSSRAEMLRRFFMIYSFLCAPTVLAEREVLLEAGLFCPTSIQVQDLDMWIKLVKKYELFVIPEKLLKYRIRSERKNLGRNLAYSTRKNFELYETLKDMFDNVPINLFREAFLDLLKKPDFKEGAEYELEKAFLYLQHNSPLIQDIAKEKLFKLLQEEKFLSVAITEYNFGLSDLYVLTNNVNFIRYSKLVWKLRKEWLQVKKFLRLN